MNNDQFMTVKAITQELAASQKARMRKRYQLENLMTKIQNTIQLARQLSDEYDAVESREIPPRPDLAPLIDIQNKMNAQIEKCAFFVLYNAENRTLHIARRSPEYEGSVRVGTQEIALKSIQPAHIWPCLTDFDAERLYKILSNAPEIFELLP